MNLECLLQLIARWHHYKNIHVAIGMRLAVGMGTKQNDFVRLEPLSHPSAQNGG